MPPDIKASVLDAVNCYKINPLNAELNPIRHLLALVGARHFVHVSGIRVNKVRAMKDVKFLDSVLTMRYHNATPLDNVTLIPLDLDLDLIGCVIYGIVVPSLMNTVCSWARLGYTPACAHSPVR